MPRMTSAQVGKVEEAVWLSDQLVALDRALQVMGPLSCPGLCLWEDLGLLSMSMDLCSYGSCHHGAQPPPASCSGSGLSHAVSLINDAN